MSAQAALALHGLGDARGFAYLEKAALAAAKPHVMAGAAKALRQVDKDKAVPILMQALEQVEKTKGMLMKRHPLSEILSSLFQLTQAHPGADIQTTDWTRTRKEMQAWKAWWQKQKAAGK